MQKHSFRNSHIIIFNMNLSKVNSNKNKHNTLYILDKFDILVHVTFQLLNVLRCKQSITLM